MNAQLDDAELTVGADFNMDIRRTELVSQFHITDDLILRYADIATVQITFTDAPGQGQPLTLCHFTPAVQLAQRHKLGLCRRILAGDIHHPALYGRFFSPVTVDKQRHAAGRMLFGKHKIHNVFIGRHHCLRRKVQNCH